MRNISPWFGNAKPLTAAMLFLACAARVCGADTYNSSNHQLSIPSVAIGNALYSNMVVTVAGIVSGPSGSAPDGIVDTYDPATNRLTVQTATVGAAIYHNVVVTVASLVSIGSVSGADTYSAGDLTIGSVLVNGRIFNDVVITVGRVVSINHGMPAQVSDV